MKDLTVSLIITTYNNPQYLTLCLRSLKGQTLMPDQVVIADDGSGPETKEVIDAFRRECPVPVLHVWHDDSGYRRAAIINKAMAAAEGSYLIVIDGDMICHRRMIEDHCRHAASGVFLCGSQNRLGRRATDRIKRSGRTDVPWWVRISSFNALRFTPLTPWMLARYKQGPKHFLRTLRGGHMSIWRDYMVAVNGYDEDFTGWGYEDTDLGVRLKNAGFRMRNLKLAGVIFHMWHGEQSRAESKQNHDRMMRSVENKTVRCLNGMDKYF
jgi:GT2 family glycosyltransferase